MKLNKSVVFTFVLLVLISSLYRIIPSRPFGFAPQIAIALFSGCFFMEKKYAFLMPLFSMLISDIVYELLFINHLTPIKGFYDGQWLNYILYCSVTFIGFRMNASKLSHLFAGAISGVLFYYISSNSLVWLTGGLGLNDLPYERSFSGWMNCMLAGVPFLKQSFISTFIFSGLLFGGYHFTLRNSSLIAEKVKA